jgi:hypothetical protein
MKAGMLQMVLSKKLRKTESIYEVSSEKATHIQLSADSSSMGYAAFLKPEFMPDGMNIEDTQRADVFMNSFIVHLT